MVQLDILRGVAILLVLFTHVDEVQKERPGLLDPAMKYLQLIGPSGVDLFFVLSGFLVGGLLIKELREKDELDVRRFLIRRGFRIWPAYFVFLAYLFLRLTFRDKWPAATTFDVLLPSLVHVQNYFWAPRPHTWSLAIEEHFYILLPLLLLLLTYRKRTSAISLSAIPAITLAVCVACAVARYFVYGGETRYNPHFATHLRLDALMFGVMLAYLYHFKPASLEFARSHRRKIIGLAVGMLLLLPAVLHAPIGRALNAALAFVFMYLVYGALLLAMVHPPLNPDGTQRVSRSVVWRVVAFIGYFSYPIYLWHIDAGRMSGRFIHYLGALGSDTRWLAMLVVYVLVTVTAGVLLGVLLDRPMLALRDRVFPARTLVPTDRTEELVRA